MTAAPKVAGAWWSAGGAVARQKVEVLRAAGGLVRVVAPEIDPELAAMPGVQLVRRPFEPRDLEDAGLVIAATADENLNHIIYELAAARGLWVNVVDDPQYCHFIFPSILRRGEFTVAVSTAGASPALARRVRQELEPTFGARFGEIVEWTRRLRLRLKAALPNAVDRRRPLEEMAELALEHRLEDPETVTSALSAVAEQSLNERATPAPTGEITLVGAGPGDPELLTLAGLKALRAADVVYYDRLVNPALLAHAPQAEHVYIGKELGRPHGDTQERINRLIVEAALAGHRVVRLKGGDPFVFGRGGEEMLAARAHGIPVRVIPGVTAGVAAPAAAEIPLTHRDLASSVVFVTGCGAEGKAGSRIDWRALAASVDTIVIYMAIGRLSEIAGELRAGGRPENEPVAIVRNGTLPDQETILTTLGELTAGENIAAGVRPPAIVIVGPVVRFRELLAQAVEQARTQTPARP